MHTQPQALGGWEARVVDGAIRAGLSPETIRSKDVMELYRALQLDPQAVRACVYFNLPYTRVLLCLL